MLTLHKPDAIFSARHLPSWLMLSVAAGCVNATAVIACERYVTHVTGTITRIGMEVARLNILLDLMVVFAAFIGGAMLSSFLINGRAHRGKRPLHFVPLIVVSALMALCALGGHFGLFGQFGGAPDETVDFVLLALLSFASGLQNASVATSTGLLVRTIHLTGPATDLGIHLVELAYTKGEALRNTQRHALLRAGKIVAFAVGAAAGVAFGHRFGFLAFLLPAAIVLIATARSFLPTSAATEPTPEIDAMPLAVATAGRSPIG